MNSNARVLKSVSFNYINLDGSEEVLNVDINKSIDWHDTYTLVRSKSPDPSKVFDVSVTIPERNDSKKESNGTANIEIPLQVDKIMILYLMQCIKIKSNSILVMSLLVIFP